LRGIKKRKLNIPYFATSIIIVIVAMSVVLVVAFAVISYLMPSSNSYTGLSAEANQTLYNTVSASFSALDLGSTLIIVAIAAAIIALIVGAFSFFRASGAAD